MGSDAALTARGASAAYAGLAMSDQAWPFALGYFRAHLLMTTAEMDDIKEQLASFAHEEGCTLGGLFVERVETTPAAFEALVEAIKRYDVSRVVVPSMRHLAVLGVRPTLADYLERCTGARVLAADRGR